MKLQKQITNEELLELTRKAFENDEVAEFLCGEKGYSVMGNRDIPINIPTDFGRIVEKGIYELYLTTNDEVIIKKFRKPIWRRFTKAIREYELVQDTYSSLVCIYGLLESNFQ